MGRGRAKAKQTKVARELKYRSVGTDFQSLEKELRSGRGDELPVPEETPVEEVPDEWADLAAKYADVDEDLRKSG